MEVTFQGLRMAFLRHLLMPKVERSGLSVQSWGTQEEGEGFSLGGGCPSRFSAFRLGVVGGQGVGGSGMEGVVLRLCVLQAPTAPAYKGPDRAPS